MSEINYTDINKAAEIIGNRRADGKLQTKLSKFLDNDLPSGPFDIASPSPNAVLAEYIARPTIRDLAFASDAIAKGFEPWWLTYEQDQVVTANEKKVGMLRPKFAINKQDVARSWLVTPNNRYGSIGDRPTIFDELPTVTDYWRAIRLAVMPRYNLGSTVGNVSDISSWYLRQAKRMQGPDVQKLAAGYYPGVMGLYAARAVLFMNFEDYPKFRPIAAQGFRIASEVLGVEPVIVKWNSPTSVKAIDGDRKVNYDQTDLTFLELKMPKSNQPPILAEITRLVLQEIQNATE